MPLRQVSRNLPDNTLTCQFFCDILAQFSPLLFQERIFTVIIHTAHNQNVRHGWNITTVQRIIPIDRKSPPTYEDIAQQDSIKLKSRKWRFVISRNNLHTGKGGKNENSTLFDDDMLNFLPCLSWGSARRQWVGETEWNKSRAAELLGVSRRTIHRKIVQYGII